MPIAAVPAYLGNEFKDASPGMRFGMYLKLWGVNRRTQALLWQTHDIAYEVRGQQQQEREVKYENKVSALADSTKLTPRDKAVMQGLASRQSALAATVAADQLLRLDALATAPFTTGLGNEHPLENGFAFLNPYGLPYLPGSGVKGVLRQAARELAKGEWGKKRGWDEALDYEITIDRKPVRLSMLDVLFGRESADGDTEHVRGALTFWDVLPQIKGDSLMVEIMTPHQSHYYQQKRDRRAGDSTSPHDSGQPNPISYLTVPPGSGFAFHVVCDSAHLTRLAPALLDDDNGKPRWQTLMTTAFEHAFQWLGFGAKTAVGYGAMESEAMRQTRAQEAERQREARKEDDHREKALRQQAEAVPWPGARLNFNRANQALTAEKDGKSASAIAPKGVELLASLPVEIRRKVETNQYVKATAYVAGTTLVRVEP
ncbi:MAG: type III-B CRISPR module RAMP protein Cmr6 [Sphingomonadaceae bacterium]